MPARLPGETASAALRRRLLAGEELDAKQVAKQYGVSRSLLSVVKGQMNKPQARSVAPKKKAPAWVAEAEAAPDLPVVVVTPKPAPASWGPGPGTSPGPTEEELRAVGPAGLLGAQQLPPLGALVTVVLHSWDPETGEYTVGLRNGRASWLVSLR